MGLIWEKQEERGLVPTSYPGLPRARITPLSFPLASATEVFDLMSRKLSEEAIFGILIVMKF